MNNEIILSLIKNTFIFNHKNIESLNKSWVMATFRLANKYCDKYCNNTLSLNSTTKTKKNIKRIFTNKK